MKRELAVQQIGFGRMFRQRSRQRGPAVHYRPRPQATNTAGDRAALISNDARIVLKGSGRIWHIALDGAEVLGPTFQRCFDTVEDAVRRALKRGGGSD